MVLIFCILAGSPLSFCSTSAGSHMCVIGEAGSLIEMRPTVLSVTLWFNELLDQRCTSSFLW